MPEINGTDLGVGGIDPGKTLRRTDKDGGRGRQRVFLQGQVTLGLLLDLIADAGDGDIVRHHNPARGHRLLVEDVNQLRVPVAPRRDLVGPEFQLLFQLLIPVRPPADARASLWRAFGQSTKSLFTIR